jgi:hypothetical protein
VHGKEKGGKVLRGWCTIVVLLPGFQKCRDIKDSEGKGQGAVLAKKGQFVSYKEK